MSDAAARIKEIDAMRVKLLTAAKNEAFARAEQAVADLNALGFSYTLADGGPKARRKTSRRKRERTIKDAPCPVCKFKTKPPHDARRHRFSQGKKKNPFTPAELQKLGLKKVA